MDGPEFVAELVAEMQELFAGLGEQGALEAESQGRVEIPTLLRLAQRSELEAAELAAAWLPTTPDLEVKMLFAEQCADEMKHYRLIGDRLAELGESGIAFDPAEGYGPLYSYLLALASAVERVAAGPFAREAIAEVRNAQFIDFCERSGDAATARLYRDVIQPEEVHHHRHGRELLERLCADDAAQRLAATAVRSTLAIADELSNLARKSTGAHPIPVS
ncbi:MAG TPA: ferritin-like domain-containing protein [Thermoanaerobaculia bacterium]|jgi:1,2-phenylacetyl-CoA epoxidase catalytic subunit